MFAHIKGSNVMQNCLTVGIFLVVFQGAVGRGGILCQIWQTKILILDKYKEFILSAMVNSFLQFQGCVVVSFLIS